MSRSTSIGMGAIAAWVLLAGRPPGAGAAERAAMQGRALAPVYSLHPDALRPGAPLLVDACVTNGNAASDAELQQDDQFTFEFSRGIVHDCLGVDLTVGDGLAASDWLCSFDDSSIRLTYGGDPRPWPSGMAACARVLYTPEARPTSVLTSSTLGRRVAEAPARSPGLVVGVAEELGMRGPAGQAGESGAAGQPGIGHRSIAHSTGPIESLAGDPPVPVPGLVATVTTGDESRLLVLLDTRLWNCRDAEDTDAMVHIEIDGIVAATRALDMSFVLRSNTTTLVHLTPPLPAGTHVVRGLANAHAAPGFPIHCLARDAPPGHDGSLRLLVFELLPH